MGWEPFRVRDAKTSARQWVEEVASHQPGFRGAFLHGSINWLSDDVPLPNNSDIDVIVVLDRPEFSHAPGKLSHEGVLLDVSHLGAHELQSAEEVLGNSHLAGSFRGASVIADPTGELTRLQEAVARDYAKREWVERRCEHAIGKIQRFLDGIDPGAPLHDQATSWLFGTGVTTHVLLVAGLRNPTVRKRYVAVRELLDEYDQLDVHEELLGLLGVRDLAHDQVQRHLDSMTSALDAAKDVIRTPFFFASDISDNARHIAIEGTQELIDAGLHREAMFWIAATYSRCQKVLHTDAPPDERDVHTPGYFAMLADLGIAVPADLLTRADEVRAFLLRLREVAAGIIAANPEIVG
jgi:hypothetical protein